MKLKVTQTLLVLAIFTVASAFGKSTSWTSQSSGLIPTHRPTPVQLLQCVLDKCHGLPERAQLYCTYRLCLTPRNQQLSSQDVADIDQSKQSSTSNRTKRWQYSDLLQVCISNHCQGQQGVGLYQCVYKKCIASTS